MNAKVLLASMFAAIGTAGAANAQVGAFMLDWQVDGQDAVSVNPGDVVTVTGVASWVPATFGFGSAQFRVNLASADASDTLTYNEMLGLGRNPQLRLLPQTLVDDVMPGGRTITGAANTVIDAAQGPAIINPLFDSSNPIEVFRFMFVAGDAGRTIDIGSELAAVNLYSNAFGQPTAPYVPVVDGASIEIVPTPGSAALVGLGGIACLRRRRRD